MHLLVKSPLLCAPVGSGDCVEHGLLAATGPGSQKVGDPCCSTVINIITVPAESGGRLPALPPEQPPPPPLIFSLGANECVKSARSL